MTEYYLEWWQKNVDPQQVLQGTRQRITKNDGTAPSSQEEATVIAKDMIDQGRFLWKIPYTAKLHIHNHTIGTPESCKMILIEEI